MPKRFTDTDKWKKQWYRKLNPVLKCFWEYLYTNCDNVGIWEVDIEAAEFFIGAELDIDEIKASMGKQFIEIENGKRWFIIDFIKFQYGELSESCNPHKPVIEKLKKLGLYEYIKGNGRLEEGYNKGNEKGKITLKEKDKEKDKDKDQDKDTGGDYKGGMAEGEGEQESYFEGHYRQYLPEKYFATWAKYVDYLRENGTKINRYNVISHLKAFKECYREGIDPPELLEAFLQSNHKGIYWVKEKLLKEKGHKDGIYAKHITESKLRRIAEDIARDPDLKR